MEGNNSIRFLQIQIGIEQAAQYILKQIALRPKVGLVLGSGLGDYADSLEEAQSLLFSEIPGFPLPTVPGHTGALVIGKKHGQTVAVLQGRIHYYEGLPQREITMPIRVLAAIGVETLILTNACGGVNLGFQPGDLMLISDHINLSGGNPLIGSNLDSFGPRFPDISDLYNAQLRSRIHEAAEGMGLPLQEGVYAMYSGPNYESPAEIRMFRILGADVVGMSTVPEALVAGHCGMKVVGISCVTNMAAGILPVKLSHQEVVETAARVHDRFQLLLDRILELL